VLSGREVGRALTRLTGRRAGPSDDEPASPGELAYTARARGLLGVALGWHVFALLVAAIPESPYVRGLREPLRTVVGPWLALTRTTQSWGIWAEPPQENTVLKVVVIDGDGHAWDMRTDVYAREVARGQALFYDRGRKIAGRIVKSGEDGPYQRPYAAWHCRRWAAEHGRPPARVELRTLSYRIPTPEESRESGGYDPDEMRSRGSEHLASTHLCR